MTDAIGAIQKSRETNSLIIAKALEVLDGSNEVQVRDRILAGLRQHSEFYPDGWYDPPPGGVSVLFGDAPFERLQFDTLRNPVFFPDARYRFGHESVGIVYASPVDRTSGMIGDLCTTIYGGSRINIKNHIRVVNEIVMAIALHVEVGMRFSMLSHFGNNLILKNGKKIAWMTSESDPLKFNFGHTIPGTFGDTQVADTFEARKDEIKTGRIFINDAEDFTIPETVAFTVETRLVDANDSDLPNTCCHIIVTFERGQKRILTDFDSIFETVGMLEYMQDV